MFVAAFMLIRSDLWTTSGAAIESIAVLPFENGTGDAESEYLCDGLTEGLINTLSQIPNLKVISRRSTRAFKDSDEDPQAIGRKLGVQALLMGRLVQRGAQLTVSAELVDVEDNHQLWGGRFNREQGDVLTIEKELTKTIAETLKIELTDDTAEKLGRRYAVDPEAHRLYLQGRKFSIGSAKEMNKAVEYFQQAIAKDPGYALPYAGLADVYLTLSFHGVMGREEALEKSRVAVGQALEIDADLAEALAASAERKYLLEWDWVGAERDFKRAVESNPGSDFVRISYAYFLSAVARFDDAIEHATIAKELDPLSPSAFHLVAYSLMGKREYDRAAAEFRAALDLNPNWRSSGQPSISTRTGPGAISSSPRPMPITGSVKRLSLLRKMPRPSCTAEAPRSPARGWATPTASAETRTAPRRRCGHSTSLPRMRMSILSPTESSTQRSATKTDCSTKSNGRSTTTPPWQLSCRAFRPITCRGSRMTLDSCP